jgi:outer membrane lipoprotein-sorting protein
MRTLSVQYSLIAMHINTLWRCMLWLVLSSLPVTGAFAEGEAEQVAGNAKVVTEARELVRQAIEHWRGTASVGEMTMTIHRPDWERSMSMRAWTQGNDRSLVRVTAPSRDKGNGTLMLDNSMWNYSPKVNRVIKVPSSMMGQSWMGSDFSNKDVSRADDIVDQYQHELLETTESEGLVVYVVESVPNEEAAVVWGKEVLRIRSDLILLEHAFYDQDGKLVKQMKTLDIGELGGRISALRQRMERIDRPYEWTELRVDAMDYEAQLDEKMFTLSSLRNPRS